MAEKYLGEQGLAKLIELVKKNSGGSPIYIKSRDANVLTVHKTIPINTLFTYVIDVSNPVGRPDIMVNVFFTNKKSYASYAQVVFLAKNALWITEGYAIAHADSILFHARLYYIGPEENAINSDDLRINSATQLV